MSRSVPISIIIPAHNEAGFIEKCLCSILCSQNVQIQVIVSANGCSDDTVSLSRRFSSAFAAKGWRLDVVERNDRGKPGALNAGDAVALFPTRVYLDADVTVSADLLDQLSNVLSTSEARFASGTPKISKGKSLFTSAYGRFWMKLPFMAIGIPGFGLFAVSSEGRARWGRFPDIIADDLFIRLQFRPNERQLVPATHESPLAEGIKQLVNVRRRQNYGNKELHSLYPNLKENEINTKPDLRTVIHLIFGDPLGFFAYAIVAALCEFGPRTQSSWARGR